MKFAEGCNLYTSLSQTQRKRKNIYVCLQAGVLLCLLQAEKNPQTFTSGSFTELFQKYKDNTVPQSEERVLTVYKLNFLYFWDLNSLQTLTKPCDTFVKNRAFLNSFSADKDGQAMHIQWRQVRKKVWESCCRFSLSPGAEKLTALAPNITVVIHYYTKTKLFCYYSTLRFLAVRPIL